MKALLFAAALLAGMSSAGAADFQLDGDLTWEITEPRLTFRLDGELRDITPGTSGTIKLVLWATSNPFSSPGYPVGEYTLGQIDGGYQFTDFKARTVSDIPGITGSYRFTITVLEYTTGGWRNRLIVPAGTASLVKGDFTTQQKWKISAKKITTPPAMLAAGDFLTLKVKATEPLNLLPVPSQSRMTLAVQNPTKFLATTAAGKRMPKYTYKIVKTTLNKKAIKAGQLSLIYPATSKLPAAEEVITLFFQGGHSGTYKSVRNDAQPAETTWGGFTF